MYFLSCQLFTTPPRLESSTRYKSFSTTTVRSCASFFAGTLAAGGPEIAVAFPGGSVVFGGLAVCPEAAGAVCPDLFACGGMIGGFGARYFTHNKITTMESKEAIRMRNSWVSLSFLFESLTNAPLCSTSRSAVGASPLEVASPLELSRRTIPARVAAAARPDPVGGFRGRRFLVE